MVVTDVAAGRRDRAASGLHALVIVSTLLAGACGRDDTGPSPVGPAIACPAAQAAQSPDGHAVAVSYPAPTVSGGTAPVTTTCTPPSGTPFSVGMTTVTCTARDARQQSASCSFGVAVAGPPKISASKFVAFGDSITAGELDPACTITSARGFEAWLLDHEQAVTFAIDLTAAYPTKLQALLTARYTTQMPSVTNRGVGGECVTSASCVPDGISRLPAVLGADAPQVLLLMEGINDINNGGAGAIPRVVSGLQTMIGQARSRGVQVLLGTLLPERVGACRGFAPAAVPPANDAIRALAASQNVDLVDLYAAFNGEASTTLIGFDGLHPTAAGYDTIAQTFFDSIRKKLEVSAMGVGLGKIDRTRRTR